MMKELVQCHDATLYLVGPHVRTLPKPSQLICLFTYWNYFFVMGLSHQKNKSIFIDFILVRTWHAFFDLSELSDFRKMIAGLFLGSTHKPMFHNQ